MNILAVMFHLPNRVFYRQKQSWDLHQLEHTVCTIFAYASPELHSFLALALLPGGDCACSDWTS